MHFGYLRQDDENEMIDKSLTDTWKLFQKKLFEAADFVAQETLVIKQSLQNTFEVTADTTIITNNIDRTVLFSILEIFERSRTTLRSIDQWNFS